METIGRLTSLLLHALETREPAVDLLSSFVDHWKSITKYYVESTDDSCPVRQTDIPWRLKQMLDILVYEEKQQGAEPVGSCLEFLLEHKLLETLCSLGKAEYPPGMLQQVLIFFSKLLSQMQKPLMQLHRVSTPVQKLIRLCALPGSQSEKEEAQFLLVISSRVRQEPHTLTNVLERVDQSAVRDPADQSQLCSPVPSTDQATPPRHSGASISSPVQSQCGLLSCLLQLTKSQRASVSLKAYESLLLLVGLREQRAEELLAAHSQLGALLAGRALHLYSLLPLEPLEAAALQGWTHTAWSSQFSRSSSESPDHVTNFFSWFDFLDHLMRDASQVLAVKLAECLHASWLVEAVQPQLLSVCERAVLLSTSVLCAAVRLVQSAALLDQLVTFLLKTPPVMRRLMQNCDHVSDQLSMVSLSLVDELLQKPHRDILKVLLLDNLDRRSYLSPPAGGQEDTQLESNEDSDDLEDDPFFSDSLFPDSQLQAPSGSSHFAPPGSSPFAPPLLSLGSAADVINSFLCLVPLQVRSARLLQEDGYESYVLDAHTLVTECQSVSESFDWPLSLPPPPSSGQELDFFEGHLLKVLLDRLGRILEQPYELNLQLTAVLSRLSAFRHPLLHEYLLDPYAHLSHCARSLFSVLVRVMGDLVVRIQQVSGLTDRLLDARRQLLGLSHHSRLDHLTLLRGVIVLEEFCKELAAIAFAKLDQH